MRHTILVLMFAGVCVAAQESDDAVKKERKLFQGKWQATFAQGFDGKEQTDVEIQLTTMEVDGDKFTMKTGSLTVSGTFTIDPTKKVKAIDVFFGNGKDNGILGIYEIKGDTRKSCFALPGKERPTAFRKDKGFMTLEWRLDK